MRLLSTAWLWLVVALTFPIGYGLALLLLVVTAPFDRHRAALHLFVTTWVHSYLHVWPWWRVRVSGRERLPRGPCVLIANHQSMADILATMGLRHHFKYVSKASLFRIPTIGWMMRQLGYVALSRGQVGSTQDMIERCDALLAAGVPILIFPEGTYATGPHRLPMKRGAFRLAHKHQVPLVPLVVHGTAELVREDGPWFEPRAAVEVEVMEPLNPPPPSDEEAPWVAEVERQYREWLTRR